MGGQRPGVERPLHFLLRGLYLRLEVVQDVAIPLKNDLLERLIEPLGFDPGVVLGSPAGLLREDASIPEKVSVGSVKSPLSRK